jgi:predicted dehydrogenase
LEITGTDGTAIVVEDALAVFAFRDARQADAEVLARHGRPGGAHGVSDPAAMTHALHAACFRDFVDALESGRRFQSDGESARKSVAVVRAIYESAASGRAVSL